MAQQNYSAQVAWSPDDSCYVATIPEFPYLSGLGGTPSSAIQEVFLALDLAIEVMEEDRIPLPKPYTVFDYSGRLNVRLPKSLHKSLAESAYREGVSLNTHIVHMLGAQNSILTLKDEILNGLRQVVCDVHRIWIASSTEKSFSKVIVATSSLETCNSLAWQPYLATPVVALSGR